MYRVVRKKWHKVCHASDFELFVLGLRCLHQNVQQRLLATKQLKIFVQFINILR